MGQPVAAYYTSVINEQWRDSSALVIRTPGCQSAAVHVYGDASLYRFFTKWVRPDLDLIDIPEGAAADLSNMPLSTCPILLWIVGVPEWDLDDLFSKLGVSRASLEIATFHKAFVIFRKSYEYRENQQPRDRWRVPGNPTGSLGTYARLGIFVARESRELKCRKRAVWHLPRKIPFLRAQAG
jgi:hypothetical protein